MAERGNIAQFEAPNDKIDVSLQNEAATQFSRSAAIQGGYYKQAGQEYQQAGKTVGDAVTQHDYMTEVSQGAPVGAALLNNKTAEWNKIASTPGALNDKDLQQNFLDNNLEPALQQYQDAFSTEQGQKWALEQADRMRQHFYDKTSADVSYLAGEQRKQDAATTLNQLGSTVANDPTSFDATLEQWNSYVAELRKDSAFETPEASAQLDKFAHDGANELAKVQVKSYADKGNFAAANHLLDSGAHDKNITPPEQSELRGYIATQKVARAVEAMQRREEQQYKDIQVNEQTTHSIFSDMSGGKMITATTALSAKGLSPQQRSDFISTSKENPGILMLPRQWLTSTDYGPGFSTTAESMQRGEMVTPAGLTKGVQMYVSNPQQAITPAGAARLQEIQDKMKTPDGASEVQMQNTVLDAMKNHLLPAGQYANDPKGKTIYNGMQSSFYALWDKEVQSGKTPAQLSDPDSKDYIGNAFMSLKRSPAQALADVTSARPANDETQKVALPAVENRKVGQTYPTARGPMVWMEGGWAKPKAKE